MRPLLATCLAVLLGVLLTGCTAEEPVPPPGGAGPRPEEPPRSLDPDPRGGLTEAEFQALHELREDAPPTLRGTAVELPGVGAKAYLSVPATGDAPRPGVVVIHEWWGLNDHVRHWADRLASAGYAALAVDLYGGEVATTRERASELRVAVVDERALAVLTAAHDFLEQDPRVRAPRTAVVGWCFGGAWSLRFAMSEPDLDAAVVYYGQPITDPQRLASLQCPLLAIFGTRDASIPVEKVREMESRLEALGKPHRILLFDAEHAFANPSGARYAEEPATQAWAAVREFLAEHLR